MQVAVVHSLTISLLVCYSVRLSFCSKLLLLGQNGCCYAGRLWCTVARDVHVHVRQCKPLSSSGCALGSESSINCHKSPAQHGNYNIMLTLPCTLSLHSDSSSFSSSIVLTNFGCTQDSSYYIYSCMFKLS
jgi:hypothetical protein